LIFTNPFWRKIDFYSFLHTKIEMDYDLI
jgi:hypothetical protein